MTANANDVVVLVVVCFSDVTKPASICNHKKFRNHENDSLQTSVSETIRKPPLAALKTKKNK